MAKSRPVRKKKERREEDCSRTRSPGDEKHNPTRLNVANDVKGAAVLSPRQRVGAARKLPVSPGDAKNSGERVTEEAARGGSSSFVVQDRPPSSHQTAESARDVCTAHPAPAPAANLLASHLLATFSPTSVLKFLNAYLPPPLLPYRPNCPHDYRARNTRTNPYTKFAQPEHDSPDDLSRRNNAPTPRTTPFIRPKRRSRYHYERLT